MPGKDVDRCVCMNVTFGEMKFHADQHGRSDVDALRARFGCGRGCALCVPYIRAMLATGRTAFAVDDPALRNAPTPQAGPSSPLVLPDPRPI